ncbi:MAG: hypothetical protein JNK16_04840, partial [Phycisphaerales bacterium]|nr:hypothetical protein [Phycisphaerales bacterium]
MARHSPSSVLPEILGDDEPPLQPVLERAEIRHAKTMVFSDDGLQTLWAMEAGNFLSHFYDIWYPISDDLYVTDSSGSWLILVSHDGVIYKYENTAVK